MVGLCFICVKEWLYGRNKELHQEFEAFCKKMGMSKTGACENALRLYMDKMNKAMESLR